MKFIARTLMVGTIAATAFAVSAAPSEAAKKKRHKMAACTELAVCSTNCSNGACAVKVCGSDGKWYDAFLTPVCFGDGCPKVCK